MVTLPHAARPQCLSCLRAMAAWFARPESDSTLLSQAEPIELENVVRCANQLPFALHLLESTQQELPEATGLLDLPDHRFDDPLARGIDCRASLGVQLAGHPVDDRGGLRQRSPARICSTCTSRSSNSDLPLAMVWTSSPVSSAIRLSPPCPSRRDSSLAYSRRCRSSSALGESLRSFGNSSHHGTSFWVGHRLCS